MGDDRRAESRTLRLQPAQEHAADDARATTQGDDADAVREIQVRSHACAAIGGEWRRERAKRSIVTPVQCVYISRLSISIGATDFHAPSPRSSSYSELKSLDLTVRSLRSLSLHHVDSQRPSPKPSGQCTALRTILTLGRPSSVSRSRSSLSVCCTYKRFADLHLTLCSGYCAYFDHQRRHNPAFRRRLQRQQTHLEKSVKAESNRRRNASENELRRRLDQEDIAGLPAGTSPEQQESYFLEQVGQGEQLVLRGPSEYANAAVHFFRALKVYPAPQELLGIYQKVRQTASLQVDARRRNRRRCSTW